MTKVTSRDEAQIIAMAKLGFSYTRIAARLGSKVTPECVSYVARRSLGHGALK